MSEGSRGLLSVGTIAPLLSCFLTVEQSENHVFARHSCSSRWQFLGLNVLEEKSAVSGEEFYPVMGELLRCQKVP